MRVIETEMLSAWKRSVNWKKSNTQVKVMKDGRVVVYLFGNRIAERSKHGKEKFTLCNHNTVTTRSRLNALGCHVRNRKRIPYRDGKEWWSDFGTALKHTIR